MLNAVEIYPGIEISTWFLCSSNLKLNRDNSDLPSRLSIFFYGIDEVMRVPHGIGSDPKKFDTKVKHCGSGLIFP